MNVLVVTDKINYLNLKRDDVEKYINISKDNIYYFCSSIESDYDIPKDIEQKLIKARDYEENYTKRYNEFLNSVEQFYYKLCEKFNVLYSPCLGRFNLYDLSQYDICALLMEFIRIYDFLRYIIPLNKIEKVIIVKEKRPQVMFKNGVFEYLYDFPVDTTIAEIVSNELKTSFVGLEIKYRKYGRIRLEKIIKDRSKDVIRYFYCSYLRVLDMLTVRNDKSKSNIIIFGSLNHLLPVVKEISEHRKVNCLFYHPTLLVKVSNTLRANGMKQIFGQGDTLHRRFKTFNSKLKVRGIAKKLESGNNNNLHDFLCSIFHEYCKFSIPEFSKRLDTYTYIIRKNNAKALLMDENVSSLRKPFELAAKRKGIPVFVVNHGVPAMRYPTFLNKTVSDASYYIVGGKSVKDVFSIYFKAKPEKIIITGTPRYDDLFKVKPPSSQSGELTVCLAPIFCLKRAIYYNFIDYTINFKENLRVIVEKCKKYKFNLIVKFHPGDSHEALVRDMFNKEGLQAEYITDQLKSIDVLKKIDLLITCWSTMALEGALLNKPVIVMNNLIGVPPPYNFAEDKIGIFARSPQDLSRLIDDYILKKDKDFSGYLKDVRNNSFKYEEFQDGMASRRVADFILDKIENK